MAGTPGEIDYVDGHNVILTEMGSGRTAYSTAIEAKMIVFWIVKTQLDGWKPVT